MLILNAHNFKSHIWCPQKFICFACRTFASHRKLVKMGDPSRASKSSNLPLKMMWMKRFKKQQWWCWWWWLSKNWKLLTIKMIRISINLIMIIIYHCQTRWNWSCFWSTELNWTELSIKLPVLVITFFVHIFCFFSQAYVA